MRDFRVKLTVENRQDLFRRDLFSNFERYLYNVRHQFQTLGQRDLSEREVLLMKHLYLHGIHFDTYSVASLSGHERALVILDEIEKNTL